MNVCTPLRSSLSQSPVCSEFYCVSKQPLNTVLCACLSVFQLLRSRGWSSPLHWCREVAATRTKHEFVQPVCCPCRGVQLDDEGHVLPQ